MAESLTFYASIELSSATIYVTNAANGAIRQVGGVDVYFRSALQIGSFSYEYQSLDVQRELPATVDIQLVNDRDGITSEGWLDQYIGFGSDVQVWDNRKVTIKYGGDESTDFDAGMSVENVYRIKRGTLRHSRNSVSFMCYDIRADHDRPILSTRFGSTAQQAAIGQFVPVVFGDFTTGLAPDQGGRIIAYASTVSTRELTIAAHALDATGFKLYHHKASTETVTEVTSGDYTETLSSDGKVTIDNTFGDVLIGFTYISGTISATEVITGGTSGATAIYRSTNADGDLVCDTYTGTFEDGENITTSGPYSATLDGATYPIDFAVDTFSCDVLGIQAVPPVTGGLSQTLEKAPDIVSYLLTTYGAADSSEVDDAGTFDTAYLDSDQADNRRWIGGLQLSVMDAIGEVIRENNLELYTDGGLYRMRFFEPNDEIQLDIQVDQFGESGIEAIYDPDALFANSITASIAPNWQLGDVGEWLEEDTQSDSTSIATYGDTVEKSAEFQWLYNVSTVGVQLQRRLAVDASNGHHATFVISESGLDADSPMWRLTLSSIVRLNDDWQYNAKLAQVRRITKSVHDGRITILALVLADGFPVWRWSSSTTESDAPMRWSTNDTTLSDNPGFWY